jgi:hypothetical protein
VNQYVEDFRAAIEEAIAKSFKELGDILRDLPKTAGEEPKK